MWVVVPIISKLVPNGCGELVPWAEVVELPDVGDLTALLKYLVIDSIPRFSFLVNAFGSYLLLSLNNSNITMSKRI